MADGLLKRIGGALEAGVNAAESATGLDLDRDGDVGETGAPADLTELHLPQLPTALAASVEKRLAELEQRDHLILELQKQLAEATLVAQQRQQPQQPWKTSAPRRPRAPRPTRRTKRFGGGQRRAKKRAQKKTTFAGFTTQGQPLHKTSAPATRRQYTMPSLAPPFGAGKLSLSPKTRKAAQLKKKLRLKSSKTRSAKKAAKYGRVSKKRGGGNYKFRELSKKKRQETWQLPEDAVVLRGLIDRLQLAAHKRMKPNMLSFEGAPMERSHLRQVMHVELGTKLKNVELDAIFEIFDRDHSGSVDFQEVVHVLFSDLWVEKVQLPRMRV